MSVIVLPPPTLEARFGRARQEMLCAVLGLIMAGADVAEEIDGTVRAIQQLQALQPYLTEKKS